MVTLHVYVCPTGSTFNVIYDNDNITSDQTRNERIILQEIYLTLGVNEKGDDGGPQLRQSKRHEILGTC